MTLRQLIQKLLESDVNLDTEVKVAVVRRHPDAGWAESKRVVPISFVSTNWASGPEIMVEEAAVVGSGIEKV